MTWIYKEPDKKDIGHYIVTTKTLTGTGVLKSYWNGKKWSFNNQTFIKYLKE